MADTPSPAATETTITLATSSKATNNTSLEVAPSTPKKKASESTKPSSFTSPHAQNDPKNGTPPVKIVNLSPKSPQQVNLSNIHRIEHTFEDGYDSDGQIGPFDDAINEEGEQLFDEGGYHQ